MFFLLWHCYAVIHFCFIVSVIVTLCINLLNTVWCVILVVWKMKLK